MKMLQARYLRLAGVLLCAATTLLLALTYRGADTDISDTIGYVQAAQQLARGEGFAYQDSHNQADRHYYLLYAFKVVRSGEPNGYLGLLPGVSLLAALVERLTGDPLAVQWFTPLAAALLTVVTFAFGTLLADAWVGLWASLILFSAPTFMRFSSALWSEIPSADCLYAGLVLIIVALKRARDDGPAAMLGLSGGLIVGATFFMRFSNITVVPAVLGLIGLVGGRHAYRQRRTFFLLGALGSAVLALMIFNALYYGSPLDTGYSPRHGWYDQPAFSLAYAFDRSFVGGYSVPQMGRELLTALGLGAVMALIGIVVKPRHVGWWLLGTFLLLLLPYMFYAFAAEGLNARFVIPALPAGCVLAGRGVTALGRRISPKAVRVGLAVAFAAVLLYRAPQTAAALDAARQSAQMNIMRARQIAGLTEPDAILLSYQFNDLLAVYGRRSVLNYRQMIPYDEATHKYDYKKFEPLLVAEIQRLLEAGMPVYYVVDRQPSLYKSFEILQSHFRVAVVGGDEAVYRVQPTD